MSHIENLQTLSDAIREKGNSHNPEYWHVAGLLDEITEDLERGMSEELVILRCDQQCRSAESYVDAGAPETALAVLTDKVSDACNGCSDHAQLDRDGYCWYCVNLYDKKPEDI